MKKNLATILLLPILILAILLGGYVMPVSARSIGTSSTSLAGSSYAVIRAVIKLSPIPDIKIGEPFTISGYILDTGSAPIPDKAVMFSMAGAYLGQASSNSKGYFERKFTKILSAGSYTITATATATHTTAEATATVSMTINPADVEVQTIPAIAGIPFQLDGQTFLSGEDGMAYVNVNTPGTYKLSIMLEQYSNPSLRVEFGRWMQQTNQPYQDIQVPSKDIIQVGLNVYLSVGQNFVDLDGYPVDPSRVSQITIRSAQGDVFVFQSGEPHWIPASRVTRVFNALQATPLLYSVQSVMVDGSNVVNQSQQRFFTHPDGYWPISLQLYSLRITARDALFGFPTGSAVQLTFPNGQITTYPLDKTGSVDIHSLARGSYSTVLIGTRGMNLRTPVALSRSQTLNSRVVSYLDLAVVGGLGLAIALGLLFYGRPTLVRSIMGLLRRPRQKEQYAYTKNEQKPDDDAYKHQTEPTIIKWS
jgi:hypothetical protein